MAQSKELQYRDSGHQNFDHTDSGHMEYEDQDSSDRTQARHPGADQKPSWQEGNTTQDFMEKLRLVDEKLAERIDERLELKEGYPNLAKAIADGFNQTEFTNSIKRNEAANDLAVELFLHRWKEFNETPEPNPLEKLNHLRHEHSVTPDVASPSGERLDMVTGTTELIYRQLIFTEALFQNEPDSKLETLYNLQMEQALTEPLTYPSHQEENYYEKLFDWVKNNEHTFCLSLSIQLARTHLEMSWERAYGSPEAYDATTRRQVTDTLYSAIIHHSKKIEISVANDDPEAFKNALDDIPRRDFALYQVLTENAGFTNILDEMRPDLPDRFLRLNQAETFAGQMNWNAVAYQDSACVENPDIRNAINSQINDFNKELENQQKLQTEHPESSYWWFEDYDRLHDIAKTMDYLTRPHDPEFWKLVDNQDEVTQEIAIGYIIDDKTFTALEAINDIPSQSEREKEAAQKALDALAYVYGMNIRSDLMDEDLASYQAHIRQIESGSQEFATAIREETGFIKAPGYEEPVFPQWADQTGTYIANVGDKLRELNLYEEIQGDHYKAVSWMIEKYAYDNHKAIIGDFQDRNEEPNRILREQEDTLRGIQIMMAPRAPK